MIADTKQTHRSLDLFSDEPGYGAVRNAVLLCCPALLVLSLLVSSHGRWASVPPLLTSLLAYLLLWRAHGARLVGLAITVAGYLVLSLLFLRPLVAPALAATTMALTPAVTALPAPAGRMVELGLISLGCANCLVGFLMLASRSRPAGRSSGEAASSEDLATLEAIIGTVFTSAPTALLLVSRRLRIKMATPAASAMLADGTVDGQMLPALLSPLEATSWGALELDRAVSTRMKAKCGAELVVVITPATPELLMVSLQAPVTDAPSAEMAAAHPFFTQLTETMNQINHDVGELCANPRYADLVGPTVHRVLRRARKHAYQLANLALFCRMRNPPPGISPLNACLRKALEPEAFPYSLEKLAISQEIEAGSQMVAIPAHYLELLCWNLADNAYRAALSLSAGGRVRIAVRSEEGWVKITVSDQAGGIDGAQMANIYTPLHGPTPGHLHLGLWAARKIATDYGGDLVVSTDRLRGTRVTVRLPMSA